MAEPTSKHEVKLGFETRTANRNGILYNMTFVKHKGHIMVIELRMTGPSYMPRFFHTFLLDSNAVDPKSHPSLKSAMHHCTATLLELTQFNSFYDADNSTL